MGDTRIDGIMRVEGVAGGQTIPVTPSLPSGAATEATLSAAEVHLGNIDAGIPAALGTAAMAASMPVTLATDDTVLLTTGIKVASSALPSGASTETSLASLKNCDHSEAVTPGDATVVAYRVIVCLTAGTLSMKATSDAAATSIPMTAGQVLSCFNIVRVMAATTGTYVGGW